MVGEKIMSKIGKIIAKVVGGIVGVVFILLLIILIKGPADPVILSDEEYKQQNQEQVDTYKNTNLSGFSTETITGESVSSELFSKYDITMVNIWFTGCSPCIEEMPDIAKLYNDLPSNFNVITICTDTLKEDGKIDESAVSFAKEVMEDADAKFMTLIPDEVLKKEISDVTTIFPTTIFVDSEGKTVGEPHFGGRTSEDYRTALKERKALLKK